ncbi:MAG TPA: hypothetical protein VJL81_00995, partial [Solirubrobacterales bacterium]|nr:hypothetical protein [Solirubrobacterales bacterium]
MLLGALPVMPASASAAFGFRPGPEGFSVAAREENGALDHQAGSHPYELVTSVQLETITNSPGEPGVPFSDGDLRELSLEFPPGLIENPTAASQCTLADFHEPRTSAHETSLSGENCPDSSQVGVATVRSSYGGGTERTFGVFSLVPPPGAPAEVGFSPFGSPIIFTPEVRQAEGEYRLILRASDISQRVNFSGFTISLWGAPWAASHNGERGDCLHEAEPAVSWANSCAAGPRPEFAPRAYLTLPSSCQEPLVYGAAATSWQQPGTTARRTFAHFNEGEAQTLEGCAELPFETSIRALLADPRASSSSGFEFDLGVRSEGLLNPKRLNVNAGRKPDHFCRLKCGPPPSGHVPSGRNCAVSVDVPPAEPSPEGEA